MENKVTRKDIRLKEAVVEAFLIGQSAKNYYLLNYGIKSKTVDLVISYSGSSPLYGKDCIEGCIEGCIEDAAAEYPKFHFSLDDTKLSLRFGNSQIIPNDQITVFERHVKVYFEGHEVWQDKNTLQFIFNDGSVVNIKTKQDILNFKWSSHSVNDFIIFCC